MGKEDVKMELLIKGWRDFTKVMSFNINIIWQ